ncbi:MAG TPA: DUF4386 domain-containing protein [Thermoanaerobaculia bacterium]|nr:DUF4386 domain-containing protein [Thermoanaerobaculia bacterium]HUM31216.1 DUF4386 domain-containing protein [Thermoanaerobaculia bacterium]HXK69548.1 DUF4386 domain-containing protein [Thermoanaerobaculia bacterium]
MTRTTNARIAGFTFLAYIAATIGSMVIVSRATSGESIEAKMASILEHTAGMHVVILLALAQALAALVLAVTLYAITRDQDHEVALIAMVCRLTEGVIAGLSASTTLALLWVATDYGPDASAASAMQTLGKYLLRDDSAVSAFFFAVGSALFAYLFLRGRMIPIVLAWLGVGASLLLVVGLPAQLVNLISPAAASVMWLPMLAFEIPLGFWLLIKGVKVPQLLTPSKVR